MKNDFYSIIIPVKNQEISIEKNLFRLTKKIKKFKRSKLLSHWEIILIDDGSSDKTIQKIRYFIKKNKNIKLLVNNKNQGKGFSIKKGVNFVNRNSKKIITIDADMPYFELLEKFILTLKNYNLVIIDRKNKNSKLINKKKDFYIYYRIIIGHLMNSIFRFFRLTSLKDTQAGLKGFDSSFKKVFKYVRTNGFLYDLEFLLILQKKKIYPKLIPCKYFISSQSSIIFNFNLYLKILFDLFKIFIGNLSKKYDLNK